MYTNNIFTVWIFFYPQHISPSCYQWLTVTRVQLFTKIGFDSSPAPASCPRYLVEQPSRLAYCFGGRILPSLLETRKTCSSRDANAGPLRTICLLFSFFFPHFLYERASFFYKPHRVVFFFFLLQVLIRQYCTTGPPFGSSTLNEWIPGAHGIILYEGLVEMWLNISTFDVPPQSWMMQCS